MGRPKASPNWLARTTGPDAAWPGSAQVGAATAGPAQPDPAVGRLSPVTQPGQPGPTHLVMDLGEPGKLDYLKRGFRKHSILDWIPLKVD